MTALHLFVILFQLLAFFCFVAAALGVPARVNLLAAGLACWVLSVLVTH